MADVSLRSRLFRYLQLLRSIWRDSGPLRPPHGWTLTNIPLDIVLEITDYLTPEARAALALTSHTMLTKLGTRSFELREPSRSSFLLLLERDGVALPCVLCSLCHLFHSPWVIPYWPWEQCNGMRACGTRYLSWTDTTMFSPYLPAKVHFNVVAALMRCYRHNSPAFTPGMLAYSDRMQEDECRIRCHYDFRIANGHVLMRTEKEILPCADRKDNLVEVPKLTKLLERENWKLGQICEHLSWTKAFPQMLPSEELTSSLNCRKAASRETFCLWTHGPECSSSECDPRRSKEIGEKAMLRGCQCCYTDSAFLIVTRGSGTSCSLTTWKDLGPGVDPDDAEWRSHRFRANTEQKRLRDDCEFGDVLKAFGDGLWYEGGQFHASWVPWDFDKYPRRSQTMRTL